MVKLGVNIDHIATLRQARGGVEPSPFEGAKIVEASGGDGITVHLREDRRHIQDKDVYNIKKFISLPLNLEMACSPEIIAVALKVLPNSCCIVPEKREELTTEGGLNVLGSFDIVSETVRTLQSRGIKVSLFIEPDEKQIIAAAKTGAEFIEIHTGTYANSLSSGDDCNEELYKIEKAVGFAVKNGLKVNAGHGLDYENVGAIAALKNIYELNIGHSIISKAVFIGLENAVKEMKKIIRQRS